MGARARIAAPEGYSDEEWQGMLRASQSLEVAYQPLAAKVRDIGVPEPEVPQEYRPDVDMLGREQRAVRIPRMTYVIRCGAYVKIGIASDIRARLRALESQNPHPLTVVALLAGGRPLERSLHLRFAALRHRDEWFREEGELAAWIKEGCPQ